MAEVQMVQLRGQVTGISNKKKNGSPFDFSEMLKGVSQSASEKKEAVRSTEEESAKSSDCELVQESERDNSQITDSKDKNVTEDKSETKESVSLTGEEIMQLAGMMNSLFQTTQESGEQTEDLLGAAEQELLVGEISATAEEEGQLLVDDGAADGTEIIGGNQAGIAQAGNGVDERFTSIQESDYVADRENAAAEDFTQLKEDVQSENNINTVKEILKPESKQEVSQDSDMQMTEQLASSANSQPMQTVSPMQEQTGTAVLKTSPDTLPEDISKTITTNMLSKTPMNTLEVTLEPATLGKITIKLIYEEGRAALSLISDNPKTLELLSQRVGDIAQILQEKTGQDTVVYTPETQYAEDDAANKEHSGRQQERKEQSKQEQTESFMQQLRLGLI